MYCIRSWQTVQHSKQQWKICCTHHRSAGYEDFDTGTIRESVIKIFA